MPVSLLTNKLSHQFLIDMVKQDPVWAAEKILCLEQLIKETLHSKGFCPERLC
jgi:hypothetical protein